MSYKITIAKGEDTIPLTDLICSCREDVIRDGEQKFLSLPRNSKFQKVNYQILNPHTTVYVMKSWGAVIATMTIGKMNPSRVDERKDYETYFNNNNDTSSFRFASSLIVAKEYRRKGLAKELMDHVESNLKDTKIKYIKTTIRNGNTASIRAIKKLGFKKIGQGRVIGKKKCLFFEKKIQ
jgi:GNAT superfamily N-acetyltransferase